ncbi:cell wall hydrolase [Anaerotalea alkaliphila]|uniref:Cell wall hydrolase n=1 Tax=Anaerotalea alkaliphila TaxID=2662126 RepID=A0A7X5HUV8_9FIRM|nr:cell wall hydrolase [Anaerotalea alkaliphila]NDL67102.1 cell wall hydrolase [Anaerotalea alkaliphila]
MLRIKRSLRYVGWAFLLAFAWALLVAGSDTAGAQTQENVQAPPAVQMEASPLREDDLMEPAETEERIFTTAGDTQEAAPAEAAATETPTTETPAPAPAAPAPSTSTSQVLSKKDYDALVKIVQAEAPDEDEIGKIMVANVIMNRVASPNFPNNAYDVIHQVTGGAVQFSPIADGAYAKAKPTKSTIAAVDKALAGVDHSKGALYFVAYWVLRDNPGNWFERALTRVEDHGCHVFFK